MVGSVGHISKIIWLLYGFLFITFFLIYSSKPKEFTKSYPQFPYNRLLAQPKVFDIELSSVPLIELNELEFSNECNEIFIGKPENPRDLILFSYQELQRKDKTNEKYLNDIENEMNLMRKVLPKVTAKVLVIGSINKDFVRIMNQYEIEIITTTKYNDTWNEDNARNIWAYEYLKDLPNEYDRVFLSDIHNVVLLNDIFKTVDGSKLYLMLEDPGKGNYHLNLIDHYSWISNFLTKSEAFYIDQQQPPFINNKLILGSYNDTLEFLEFFSKIFNLEYKQKENYDLVLINVLYFKNYFQYFPIQIENCTQRMCSNPSKYSFQMKKVLLNSGCSPILIYRRNNGGIVY
ncbi:hypothetical protein EHI8A_171000 [Entamoeba histolytica HM-1:IMSS-B]|uniref:Uncharacterized protein n=5 Tax=Entamoeba histolytica TaxID=5759 RepID=C4M1N4_ENTH1|nr:hypothetical protein EHI_062470 [Entamoeba histolytica HM-1:IMSS]EMH73392.1 hypothetical protein EHI8A_171000 [Entamoeba histolytica HM-1:IMSS-B]EMS12321.1 hypothetical protein KM1_244500 [Entamoeba histolytica HM-3:IMSS]ENY64508.1 hypothetical protein EHI7A_152870 [Entamoeba histolytica HM-1:IMSS-A]GAT95139.1 hypothetical protein CL6EHI_062470 [Entamoeba histolytica]EAL45759.1 hypothetical protein EHI_062470 [Entamoeba histolytica HM-1:IMSS]|eukprot:XP_651146.1 hypothetical protein EHI_062470 [Entamoeba histolytica HM-1:IMSS]